MDGVAGDGGGRLHDQLRCHNASKLWTCVCHTPGHARPREEYRTRPALEAEERPWPRITKPQKTTVLSVLSTAVGTASHPRSFPQIFVVCSLIHQKASSL